MFKHTSNRIISCPSILGRRWASSGFGGAKNSSDSTLPRRPMKKIKLGKARPAIYYQFNCKTELSDGSVVIRRSQYPKDELRLIQDQRNNPLWNPNRADLEVVDANAGGRMARFRQRYAQFDVEESIKEDIEKKQAQEGEKATKVEETAEAKEENQDEEVDSMMMDEYLELLGQNVQEVQKGGKVATKASRRRK
ncbi:unnamed protein product [Wickerhamomyces anomalus]